MRRVRLALIIVMAVEAACATGCGIGTTAAENRFMISRVADTDARMMTDDLMLAAQTNRPWRGSRYPMK